MRGFVLADNGFGHMNGMGMGMGMWITGLILLLAMVGLITWLVVSTSQGSKPTEETPRTALDVLDDRYARGEIDRKDYLERRADLEDRD